MEPIKVLIFGTDDLFPQLKPYYDAEVEKGNMEIVGYAKFEDDKIALYEDLNGKPLSPDCSFNKIIISSKNNFFLYLETFNIIQNNGGGGIRYNNS